MDPVLRCTIELVVSSFTTIGMSAVWVGFVMHMSRSAALSVAPQTKVSSRHPEPLASWARAVCSVIDGDGLWLDQPPSSAAQMLRAWGVAHVTTWRTTLLALLVGDRGIDAWDGVRAIRILMAGARLGWCKEEFAWAATRTIAVELARRYASFGDVGADFVMGRRRWAQLPLDGRSDDACTVDCVARVSAQRMATPSIAFTAFFDAPAHPKLRDVKALRDWLRGSRAAPPAVPSLSRCAFCRDVFRGRPRACPTCGAPTADAMLTKERPRLRA